MRKMEFEAIGKVYLTPGQKQARYIRQLERAVLVLGSACIFLAVMAFLFYLLWHGRAAL